MNVMFGINAIYILYFALSGLILLFHLHKRLTPFVGEYRPFRALICLFLYSSGRYLFTKNNNYYRPFRASIYLYSYPSKRYLFIKALKGRHTSGMGTVHFLSNTPIPALKGRHTSGMDNVRSNPSGMEGVRSDLIRINPALKGRNTFQL